MFWQNLWYNSIMKKIFFTISAILFFLPIKFIQAGWDVDELEQFNLPNAPVYYIIFNLFNWLLGIVGVISIISFIIAGILYLTAAGDETQATRAKKAMTYSIIGVIVALSGFVILQAARYMLTGASIF